eukprot:CAMPEP_0113971360 /NCGR_PEP_ID=MMETSP0011_2-20120614/12198_1 /TAXON_ID=101924 /ORGANISM="Rhodosorus marinus" /LENGTH=396 /DNA_ID=CAMNT_0000986857 /DNA_START=43 /DNA_END=1235 /DNA_ORIENTATION=+ /assembly_acc=CAM_ASM_000156
MVEIAVRWQLNRHVDAVVAAKMGNVVAATSSLNGSDWDGQVLGLTSDGTTEADFLVECGISDLCSSGEGHFIAACDDGLIRVIHKEGVLPLPGGHNDCATSIAMASGREKLVVSGGMDATVMLWDLDTPDRPSKFECHSDGINSIEWMGSSILTSSSDGSYAIWDLRDRKIKPQVKVNDQLIEWMGSSILTSSSDGSYAIWDLRDRKIKPQVKVNVGAIVYAATSENSDKVVLSTEHCDILAYDSRMTQPEPLWTLTKLTAPARRLKTSPHDSSILAAGTDEPSTVIVDTTDGGIKKELYHHKDFVRGVAWNPETPRVLYCGSWDKTVSMVKLDLNHPAKLSLYHEIQQRGGASPRDRRSNLAATLTPAGQPGRRPDSYGSRMPEAYALNATFEHG